MELAAKAGKARGSVILMKVLKPYRNC
jgi:hypothetical protein